MPLKDFPADLFRDELANEGVVTDAVDYTESLVREILSASDDTAMIMLSTWAVPHPYINGAEKHNIVAEYYVSGLRSFGINAHTQGRTSPASRPEHSSTSTTCKTRTSSPDISTRRTLVIRARRVISTWLNWVGSFPSFSVRFAR
jgi:hypothetical protein